MNIISITKTYQSFESLQPRVWFNCEKEIIYNLNNQNYPNMNLKPIFIFLVTQTQTHSSDGYYFDTFFYFNLFRYQILLKCYVNLTGKSKSEMNWWQKLKLIDKVVGVWKILVSNSTEFILLRIARRWSKWWGDLWNFLRVWKMRFFFRSYLNVVDFMTVRRWDVVDSSYLIINNYVAMH